MYLADKTLTALNTALEEGQDKEHRTHLGASVIGRECIREVWYIWRWARKVKHEGRLLRLFDRGNLEELRFAEWLRKAGMTVYTHDPDGKQYRVADCEGHFGGSLDAVLVGVPDLPIIDAAVLGEFKTHNDKNFKLLVQSGVRVAKPEHYVQMQIYMHYYRLLWALYLGINKNDDDIHPELVEYHPVTAERYIQRAQVIVWRKDPPDRINKNPSWYKCKMCDFHGVCHKGETPDVNCRTCQHSEPDKDARWVCTLHGHLLDKQAQHLACTEHTRRF